MNQNYQKEKLKNFNIEYRHPSYDLELKLINEAQLCLIDDALKTMDAINNLEQPTYSSNTLRDKKISLIAWCSVFTKGALSIGTPYEKVLVLRNELIMHIDTAKYISKIQSYEYTILDEYVKLIKKSKVSGYTYPVSNIMAHIYSHSHEKLTVASISDTYSLNGDYISRLFKDTVGIQLSTFIQNHKLEIAKKYLLHSAMNMSEIADQLSFCHSAYFSKLFKRYTGHSPLEFRQMHLR